MQSKPTATGMTLGQALGSAAVLLVLLLGAAFALKVYWLQQQGAPERAERHLKQSMALLTAEMNALFVPVQDSAVLLRDSLIPCRSFDEVENTLNILGPALLRRSPNCKALIVVHENGEGWELRRHGSGLWARRWGSYTDPFAETTPPWRPLYGATENGDTGPELDKPQDWRNTTAYRGAVSTSRERGDGNQLGTPRIFWTPPRRDDDGRSYMTQALSFSTAKGAITTLTAVDVAPIHRFTSRFYENAQEHYLVATAEDFLLGAPAHFSNYLGAGAEPGLPAFEAIESHPAVAGLKFWRTQSPAPTGAFRLLSGNIGWIHHFQRWELAPERSLLLGASVRQNAFGQSEQTLLFWVGIVTLAGAGIAILGSMYVAWRIRRPIEAVILEGSRVDLLEAKRAFWPKTRLIELAALYEMFSNLREQMNLLLREASTPPENEVPPEEGPKAAFRPPDAFVQAMATTRNELRKLKGRMLEQRQEQQALQGEKLAHAERIEAQCNALTALLNEVRRPGPQALATRLAGLVHRYTGIEGVSVWALGESLSSLERVAAAGPGVPPSPVEALPEEALNDLLARSNDEAALVLRHIYNDVRTATIAPTLALPSHPNLLIAGFPTGGTPTGVLCFHRPPELPWEKDWQTFLLSLAGLLAKQSAVDEPSWAQHESGSFQLDKSFFQELTEHAPGMVLVLDDRERIRYANPAAEQYYANGDTGLLNRPYRDLLAPEALPREEESLKKIRNGLQPPAFQSEHHQENGKSSPLWVSMTALLDEYDDIIGLVVWALEIPRED